MISFEKAGVDVKVGQNLLLCYVLLRQFSSNGSMNCQKKFDIGPPLKTKRNLFALPIRNNEKVPDSIWSIFVFYLSNLKKNVTIQQNTPYNNHTIKRTKFQNCIVFTFEANQGVILPIPSAQDIYKLK